jgi:hypothetical protein
MSLTPWRPNTVLYLEILRRHGSHHRHNVYPIVQQVGISIKSHKAPSSMHELSAHVKHARSNGTATCS